LSRWSTLVVDEASVSRLGVLNSGEIASHANVLAERRLRPHDLYGRWEKQQWSADAVALERDRESFQTRLPRTLKRQLEATISTFIVGEYTGLDLLSPIQLGAPAEEDLIFLGTQVADESRHARLMFRVGHEVLGYDPDPAVMLRQAWQKAEQEHRDLAVLEGQIMRESIADPGDYEKWLRCVTLFHLVTEGVLAVSGQRSIVSALGHTDLLPGIRSAFSAMCRDESRHISYGLHALRIGLQEGHAEAIYDVLERAMPLALTLTDRLQPTSAFVAAASDQERVATQTGAESFLRAMRWIGADPAITRHVLEKAGAVTTANADQTVHRRGASAAPSERNDT
jgi:ribonucleoside-diphosphate reductase beta chain